MPIPVCLDALLGHRRTLLLQGPMGPFFRKLARFLELEGGQQVWKVNFNGGDALFYQGRGTLHFRGRPEDWIDWLRSALAQLDIDAIVLFGQMRPLHVQATALAHELGIAVHVFEEGYLRPDYVTLEQGGVNVRSSLPRHPDFYRCQPPWRVSAPMPTRQRFRRMALYAMAYASAMAVARPWFPHALYHRPMNPLLESARWIRGGLRKLWHDWAERKVLGELTSLPHSQRWFLLPLQVHNDSQIRCDSPFRDMEEVITRVMASFAAHAPADHALVVKHHPMDRAHKDYTRCIERQAHQHGLSGRVRYIHDQHLPTLLKHARGVVTVNSTVGLQALHHGRPVCTLADCVYSVPGLVHQEGLDTFWRAPTPVDRELYRRFRQHAVRQTQLNASFYGAAPGLAPARIELARRRRAAALARVAGGLQAVGPHIDQRLPGRGRQRGELQPVGKILVMTPAEQEAREALARMGRTPQRRSDAVTGLGGLAVASE